MPHAAIPRTRRHVTWRRVQTDGGQLSGDCRLMKAASRHGDQGQARLLIIPPYYAKFPIAQSMINKLSSRTIV